MDTPTSNLFPLGAAGCEQPLDDPRLESLDHLQELVEELEREYRSALAGAARDAIFAMAIADQALRRVYPRAPQSVRLEAAVRLATTIVERAGASG